MPHPILVPVRMHTWASANTRIGGHAAHLARLVPGWLDNARVLRECARRIRARAAK